MKFSPVIVQALLSAVALAAAVPRSSNSSDVDTDEQYDAVVIGGGPSGLSALSGLARVRRKVLLIDSGEYRNGPTRHMHDVLGFDGVKPAWYRYAARKQISYYDTVTMTNGTVASVTPPNGSVNSNTTVPYFTITTSLGNSTDLRNITARRVILGTGLRDLLPDTPGITEYWGSGGFWCPWCDGHEHADQPLGIIGALSSTPANVREMSTLNSDIIAFVNGTDTEANRKALDDASPGWQSYLEYMNVTIENRTISAVVRLRDGGTSNNGTNATAAALPSVPEYDLFRVDFTSGPSVERAAFLLSVKNEQRSSVGADMGVVMYGGRFDVSADLETSVAGAFAVGDANSDNSTNVPHALYTGKRAAVYAHLSLAKEDASKFIYIEQQKNATATASASVPEASEGSVSGTKVKRTEAPVLEAREVWKVMNRDEDDMLYAGEFDQ